MEKVQLSPALPLAAREPPVMVSRDGTVPSGLSKSGEKLKVEPAPQLPFAGIGAAVGMMSAKSSVKVMAVAGEAELLVIVNSRTAVPPGDTGSLVNDLVKVGAGSARTVSRSVATLPFTVPPLTVAETVPLVLR